MFVQREVTYGPNGCLTLVEDGKCVGSWVGVSTKDDHAEERIVGRWTLGIRDTETAVRELDTLCIRA